MTQIRCLGKSSGRVQNRIWGVGGVHGGTVTAFVLGVVHGFLKMIIPSSLPLGSLRATYF